MFGLTQGEDWSGHIIRRRARPPRRRETTNVINMINEIEASVAHSQSLIRKLKASLGAVDVQKTQSESQPSESEASLLPQPPPPPPPPPPPLPPRMSLAELPTFESSHEEGKQESKPSIRSKSMPTLPTSAELDKTEPIRNEFLDELKRRVKQRQDANYEIESGGTA